MEIEIKYDGIIDGRAITAFNLGAYALPKAHPGQDVRDIGDYSGVIIITERNTEKLNLAAGYLQGYLSSHPDIIFCLDISKKEELSVLVDAKTVNRGQNTLNEVVEGLKQYLESGKIV